MVNKKGQEGGGPGIGLIIGFIVVAVAALIVILFFTGTFGGIGEKFQIALGGMSAKTMIETCNIAAEGEDKFNYCQDFKEVTFSTGKEWVNCIDSKINPNVGPLDCGAPAVTSDTLAKAFCNTKVPSLARVAGPVNSVAYNNQLVKSCNDLRVNGLTCKERNADCAQPPAA